jgi:hypothetical protein
VNPISPAGLLLLLEARLAPFCAARKGLLSLAGDPGDLMEALGEGPKTFRVVLNWAGDDDQTGQAEVGIVTNKLEVWLIKAKGLRLKPGDHLVRGAAPFLSLLSDLRAWLRAMEWPADVTDQTLLYRGAQQFEPELALLLPTTGYKLTFELTTVVPHLE